MEQTKILVVDDDREIVGAIAALLELEGNARPAAGLQQFRTRG